MRYGQDGASTSDEDEKNFGGEKDQTQVLTRPVD